jgi:hypothetical protein
MKTVLLLIGFILSSIHSAEAQQATKIPRIGYPGRLGSIIEVARTCLILNIFLFRAGVSSQQG